MNGLQPFLARSKWSFFAVVIGLLLLLIAAFWLWLGHPVPVQASSSDLTKFENKYAAAQNSRIDSCTLCHVSTNPVVLNPYGTAYKNQGGRNAAAMTAIENNDSDGDGFTNVQEINAHTFPGNASDKPAAATPAASPTPTRTSTPGTSITPTPVGTSAPPPQNPIFIPIIIH